MSKIESQSRSRETPPNKRSTQAAGTAEAAVVVTADNVGEFVAEWAKARGGQFSYNWVVKGGWEGWVQVDLVAYIFAWNVEVDVLREQAIYVNTNQRVDLLFNGTSATESQIPMEMKAQSLNNSANFLPGLESDLEKIENERQADYADSTCIVMGIAATQDAVDGMFSITYDGDPVFANVYQDSEVAVGLATWEANGGWVDAG